MVKSVGVDPSAKILQVRESKDY